MKADRWTRALVVALAIGLPLLLWLGRGMTFFSDEWAFIESRSLGDPATWLPPHNEHWSTLPILLYRLLVETVGLQSYVPYLAVVVALHGVVVSLVFVAVRRSSGPIVALGIAVVLVVFGSGFENLYWGFQTGFVGASAAGIAALLALDRDDPRGHWTTTLLLLVAEMTAGVALAFFVAVAVEVVMRRRLVQMAPFFIVPVVTYSLWFYAFGRYGITTRSPLSVEALFDVPSSIVTGVGNAAGAITGVGPTLGLAVAAGILVWAAYRLWRDRALPPRFVGCMLGIVFLYALIGVTRAHEFEGILDYTRYTYVSSILLLVGLSALVGRVEVPAPGRARLVAVGVGGGLLAVSLAFNARLLVQGRALFLERALETRAFVTAGLERPLPASTDPDRSLVLVPSPASLERIVRAYGSPLADSILPGAVPPIPAERLDAARRAVAEGVVLPR